MNSNFGIYVFPFKICISLQKFSKFYEVMSFINNQVRKVSYSIWCNIKLKMLQKNYRNLLNRSKRRKDNKGRDDCSRNFNLYFQNKMQKVEKGIMQEVLKRFGKYLS